MSLDNPFGMHYQRVWEERAGDIELPQWLRVAALAYGKHARNGHAVFKRGHVGIVLARPDDDGVMRPDRNVSRAVKKAVEAGWLAPGSQSRCLIVPAHAVEGGLGSQFASCPIHDVATPTRAQLRYAAA